MGYVLGGKIEFGIDWNGFQVDWSENKKVICENWCFFSWKLRKGDGKVMMMVEDVSGRNENVLFLGFVKGGFVD